MDWNGTLCQVIDPTILKAIDETYSNPHIDLENELKSLWTEVAPDVYAAQLLQPDKIHIIRQYLNSIYKSGIPTRRPNGMNRYGFIPEPTIDGSVLLSPLNQFYKNIAEHILRPLGRTFFPE